MKVNKMKKYYIELELKTIVDSILKFHFPLSISKYWIILSLLIFHLYIRKDIEYSLDKLNYYRKSSIIYAGILVFSSIIFKFIIFYIAGYTLIHLSFLLFHKM